MSTQASDSVDATKIDFDSPQIKRYNQRRKFKDQFASISIAWGGMGVIAAILLIFAYLLYEVIPLFETADVEPLAAFDLPNSQHQTLYIATEEQNEIALQVTDQGEFIFFNLDDGSENSRFLLPLPAGVSVSSFALDSDASRLMAFGLSNGQVILAKHQYRVTYPNDQRLISPLIEYPFGQQPLDVEGVIGPIDLLAIRNEEEALVISAVSEQSLFSTVFVKEEDMFSDELVLEPESLDMPELNGLVSAMKIDIAQRWLYVLIDQQQLLQINLQSGETVNTALAKPVADMRMLLGGISLLLAYDDGSIEQWFQVVENSQRRLKKIRDFTTDINAKHNLLALEQRRKGFATADEQGFITLYHSTAHQTVFQQQLFDGSAQFVALSPRANRLMVVNDAAKVYVFTISNNHPETSAYSLWEAVWYESYDQPEYTWQSSSSSNDFEPKLSLTPLSFGTLKAAFYAMLLGAPLAICGAIYTAYFMTPVMRRKIKPLIELMEALPTVILGFLAGLWLAPFMEKHLAGIFTILIFMPIGILLFAFVMSRLPVAIQNVIDDGWHGFILIPVVIAIGLLSFAVSGNIEQGLFGGDMRSWLTNEAGIPFDQRNALVVGIAMGFAVIPTIFSIAEDAIFSVPKHLSYGSLALGATPWQTLVGVVLPTASPGIFSAMMIGLGRAVGETMIVLMATGNTPIMDANIFEGMRTLSANLAVEIPEAEVDSTHYRVLFLAAFVLFLFTFMVNTAAEVVRQSLRKKYGSL